MWLAELSSGQQEKAQALLHGRAPQSQISEQKGSNINSELRSSCACHAQLYKTVTVAMCRQTWKHWP